VHPPGCIAINSKRTPVDVGDFDAQKTLQFWFDEARVLDALCESLHTLLDRGTKRPDVRCVGYEPVRFFLFVEQRSYRAARFVVRNSSYPCHGIVSPFMYLCLLPSNKLRIAVTSGCRNAALSNRQHPEAKQHFL